MINYQNRFVFIHIPKTGGTSIEKVFECDADTKVVELKHHTIRETLAADPLVSDFYKFSVVRNPWDITCSMYTYMWKSDYPWPSRWREKLAQTTPKLLDLSFNGWVSHPSFKCSPLRSAALFNDNHHKVDVLQSDWLMSGDENMLMDFVCKFENLQGDFNRVCSNIGLEAARLNHIFKSKKAGYQDYYNEETKKIVATKYEKDIDLFKYSF